MIHNIFFCNRKVGLSRIQAQRHLRDIHGPLARQIPGMRQYVQGCTLCLYGDDAAPDWLSEQWFDDLDAVKAGFTSKENVEQAKPDTLKFGAQTQLPGRPRRLKLQAIDHVLKQGPAAEFKYVNCFRPAASMSTGDFFDHWRNDYAKRILDTPGLARYTQSHCLENSWFGDEEDAFSGVEHLWFNSMNDLEEAIGSTVYQESVRPDWQNFTDETAVLSFAVREHVVVGKYSDGG